MFTPVNVAKFSAAASVLCAWIHALPDQCLAVLAKRQRSKSPSGSPFRDIKRLAHCPSNISAKSKQTTLSKSKPRNLGAYASPGSVAGLSSIEGGTEGSREASFIMRTIASKHQDSPSRGDFLNTSIADYDEFSQAKTAVDKMLPALNRAEEALRCVTSSDIEELK